MPLKIRPETPSDYPAITEVNDLAFGQPDEAFMALELKKGALDGTGGVAEYPEEFNNV